MLVLLIFIVLPAFLTFFMRKYCMTRQFYQMLCCMTALYVAAAGAAAAGKFFAKLLPAVCEDWCLAIGAAAIALPLYLMLLWIFHFIREPDLDFWQAHLIGSVFTFFTHVFLFAFLLGLWCSSPGGAKGAYPVPAALKRASGNILNSAFGMIDSFSMQSGANRSARVTALEKWLNPPKSEKKKIQEQRESRIFPHLVEQPVELRAYADERSGNYITVTTQILPPPGQMPQSLPGASAKSNQNDSGKNKGDSESDTE